MTISTRTVRFAPAGMLAAELGRELGAQTLYNDKPYGYLLMICYELCDVYEGYTSEHTDEGAREEMRELLPADFVHMGSESSDAFGFDALHCKKTILIHYRKKVPIGLITAEIVFTAKGVRILR